MASARTRRRYAPRLPPEERREQLLDAALTIITERGYAAVSIEAVAREVGVTRPVVYSVFPGLPVLLGALFRREERRSLTQLAGIVPADPGDVDPDDLVLQGLAAFLRTVRENPDTWRLILLPVDGTPDFVHRQVKRHRERILQQVRTLVSWGLKRRGGPPGVEEDLVARSILVLGEEAGRLVLTDPKDFSPERLTAFTAALLAAIERTGREAG